MKFQRASVRSFLVFAAVVLVGVPSAFAEETKLEVNDPNAIKVNLEKLAGQSVTLRMSSGEELAGVVAEVGSSAVHLTSLTGKEFYDAVVRLDQVGAVIMRVKR